MFLMQYFVPNGYPKLRIKNDPQVNDMVRTLRSVGIRGAYLPNSAIWFRLRDAATLEIKKREQLVYLNFFCVDGDETERIMEKVNQHYKKYNLGTAAHALFPGWVHSIPVHHEILSDNETDLCQRLTTALYILTLGAAVRNAKISPELAHLIKPSLS